MTSPNDSQQGPIINAPNFNMNPVDDILNPAVMIAQMLEHNHHDGPPRDPLTEMFIPPSTSNIVHSDDEQEDLSHEEIIIRSRGRKSTTPPAFPIVKPPYNLRSRAGQETPIVYAVNGSGDNPTSLVHSSLENVPQDLMKDKEHVPHEEQQLMSYFFNSPVRNGVRPDPFKTPTPKKPNPSSNTESKDIEDRMSPRKKLARRRILVGSPAYPFLMSNRTAKIRRAKHRNSSSSGAIADPTKKVPGNTC